MMHRQLLGVHLSLVFGGMFAVGGCGSVPALPATFEIATTAASVVEVDAGTGPIGFADSVWSLARPADPDQPDDSDSAVPPGPYGGILNGQGLPRPPVGERIFLVHFGTDGEMVEVTENRYFLPEFYRQTVPIGGTWWPTTLPGVSFRGQSYGTQTGDRFGLAVVVNVRFGNLYLGQAVLYAWGTQTGDTAAGTFGYLLDFTDGIVPQLGTIADQYAIQAQRVE